MFRKRLLITGLTAVSVLTLAACQNQAEGDDAVVTGNGINISAKDFNEELRASAGDGVLYRLILTEIFKKEVDHSRYQELEKQADTTIAASKAQAGADGFQNLLQQLGITDEKQYRDNLVFYSLINEVVPNYIEVTDDELQKAYDDYQPKTTVSHILVDDEDKAKDLIKQLNDGADFAELAKENSTDDQTKDKGGSLGEMDDQGLSRLQTDFLDKVKALKPGEISQEPAKTTFGYHVVKVDKREDKPSFDDLKDELKKNIAGQKVTSDQLAIVNALHQLITKYNIEVHDEDLKHVLDRFDPEKVKAMMPGGMQDDDNADDNNDDQSGDENKDENNGDDNNNDQSNDENNGEDQSDDENNDDKSGDNNDASNKNDSDDDANNDNNNEQKDDNN